MTEKIINRYVKVKALAEGGSDGEKEAAKRILVSLEKKHPGIRLAADTQEAAGREADRRSSPTPPPGRTGNWEQIFRYAAGVYSTVKDVVEDVTEALQGKDLAYTEVEFSGTNRKQSLFVRMKLSYSTVLEARSLNGVQQEFFRQGLHDQFDEFIDAILKEE